MKLKIGLFFGGKSVEHEISVISALQAYESIDKDKYDITPVYITKDMDMYIGEHIGDIGWYIDIPALLNVSRRVIFADKGQLVQYPFRRFGNNVSARIDIAFPIVHGTNVEDGALQGFFQTVGVPYVSSGVTASAAGMDKAAMKAMLNGYVNILDCLTFRLKRFLNDGDAVIGEIESVFGYPVIVKPVNLGSSVGIKIAKDRVSLAKALTHGFMFAGSVLVERAITNLKEINCAVLGDADFAEASECEEPLCSGEILDYTDKYGGDGGKTVQGGKAPFGGIKSGGNNTKNSGMASLKRKIPAEISPETRDKIREYAVLAFKRLGCMGVARIDFMIDTDNGEVYLNEINTIPGSLSFYLWEPLGIKYRELLDRMIELALKREKEKRSINFSFESNVLKSFGKNGK